MDETILIIDCATGEQTERPLTEEEQQQRQVDQVAGDARDELDAVELPEPPAREA